MTHSEFALKYPETVVQIQNIVFPYLYEHTIYNDAYLYIQYLIKNKKEIMIDIKAVDDALNLYNTDNEMFFDYKDIKKDFYILLSTKTKTYDRE